MRMKLLGYTACMGAMRNAYVISEAKWKEKD
jgi:hypothetical protein